MSKPERVQKAVFSGNKEAQAAMGRKGGLNKVRNEDADRLEQERIAEVRAAEEKFRLEQSGEHLAPPDLIN